MPERDQRRAVDGFIDVPLSSATLDRWIPRGRILDALRRELPNISGTVLDVGCGRQPYRSLILSPPSAAERCVGLDIPSDRYGGHDVGWDGRRMPIASGSVHHVLATEVLEHCPYPELIVAEMWRVLRPGGRLFFTVPFLWPLHDSPHDEYRYTPYALERILTTAGFSDVTISALGGWDASLAQLIGLWVRRRPMGRRTRRVLSALAVPIVRVLAGRDLPPERFGDGVMLTGLSGTARKGG